jgi:hypothetical protein
MALFSNSLGGELFEQLFKSWECSGLDLADGGMGTSWYSDPGEDLIGILMTQQAWTSPSPANTRNDFWTSAYQAIDD